MRRPKDRGKRRGRRYGKWRSWCLSCDGETVGLARDTRRPNASAPVSPKGLVSPLEADPPLERDRVHAVVAIHEGRGAALVLVGAGNCYTLPGPVHERHPAGGHPVLVVLAQRRVAAI